MALDEIRILRLEAGDTDRDFQWLSDEEYQYAIDTIPNKRKRSKYIDMLILSAKSGNIHERSGQEEMWGNQYFEQSLQLVKLKWKDPVFAGQQALPSFGGTSREEMFELATDPDRVPDTFYKGESQGKAEWQQNRIYRFCGQNLEPYRTKLPFCFG